MTFVEIISFAILESLAWHAMWNHRWSAQWEGCRCFVMRQSSYRPMADSKHSQKWFYNFWCGDKIKSLKQTEKLTQALSDEYFD